MKLRSAIKMLKMMKKIPSKELLRLAGRLATAADIAVCSTAKNISTHMEYLEETLDEYNNAIMHNLKLKNK